VEGTINGIGERAGNTALEEVALALHIRNDFYQATSNIKLNETKRTSDLVARLSGITVPKNKAIVGGNAYAHESGIHQDGVLKNPDTYEIITPQLVGVQTNSLPLGKLSGRHAFVDKMQQLGYQFDQEETNELFKRFKELADKKKQVTEQDLLALVADQGRSQEDGCELESVQLQYVSNGHQGAVVSMNYEITALTSGEDAQAEGHVVIECQETNEKISGIGLDFDVLQASAKAYVQASAALKNRGVLV